MIVDNTLTFLHLFNVFYLEPFYLECVYCTNRRIEMKELAIQVFNAVKNGILREPFNAAMLFQHGNA